MRRHYRMRIRDWLVLAVFVNLEFLIGVSIGLQLNVDPFVCGLVAYLVGGWRATWLIYHGRRPW